MRGDTAREGTQPGRGRSRAEDTACCLGPWSAQCRQAASASMGAQAPWLLPLWPRCVFRATLPTPRSPLLSSPLLQDAPGVLRSFPLSGVPGGMESLTNAGQRTLKNSAGPASRAGLERTQPQSLSPFSLLPSRGSAVSFPSAASAPATQMCHRQHGTPSHDLQDGFLETATLGPRTHSRSPSNIVSFSTISL